MQAHTALPNVFVASPTPFAQFTSSASLTILLDPYTRTAFAESIPRLCLVLEEIMVWNLWQV
jgi:hypothetical protein